jgi:hypothetical protein
MHHHVAGGGKEERERKKKTVRFLIEGGNIYDKQNIRGKNKKKRVQETDYPSSSSSRGVFM